jgi:flagellar biosynthesis anti-sigma factor FlgM
MRVNDPNLNPAALNSTSTSGSANTGATGKTAQLDPVKINTSSGASSRAGDRGDQVELSGLSSKINELQSGSPAREAYLESLRLEVASGQYQSDPAELASSIIKDALTTSE